MPIIRLADWPQRLAAYLASRQFTPFLWGSNDCCRFAADGVQAITGHDYMASLRSQYATPLQASRLLKKQDGLLQLTCKQIGQPLPSPLMASRGDVVLFDTPAGTALGLCVGAQIASAGISGTVFCSMTAALAAWGV